MPDVSACSVPFFYTLKCDLRIISIIIVVFSAISGRLDAYVSLSDLKLLNFV